ncbi:uncharacterized protein V1516DRAFT_3641 [Lipomyces oligophaga]|uniref:uncharacterized protein n=1 Tax=Lipomyces oligophaga TaxID=45792 RepID=UPI0034CDC880
MGGARRLIMRQRMGEALTRHELEMLEAFRRRERERQRKIRERRMGDSLRKSIVSSNDDGSSPVAGSTGINHNSHAINSNSEDATTGVGEQAQFGLSSANSSVGRASLSPSSPAPLLRHSEVEVIASGVAAFDMRSVSQIKDEHISEPLPAIRLPVQPGQTEAVGLRQLAPISQIPSPLHVSVTGPSVMMNAVLPPPAVPSTSWPSQGGPRYDVLPPLHRLAESVPTSTTAPIQTLVQTTPTLGAHGASRKSPSVMTITNLLDSPATPAPQTTPPANTTNKPLIPIEPMLPGRAPSSSISLLSHSGVVYNSPNIIGGPTVMPSNSSRISLPATQPTVASTSLGTSGSGGPLEELVPCTVYLPPSLYDEFRRFYQDIMARHGYSVNPVDLPGQPS